MRLPDAPAQYVCATKTPHPQGNPKDFSDDIAQELKRVLRHLAARRTFLVNRNTSKPGPTEEVDGMLAIALCLPIALMALMALMLVMSGIERWLDSQPSSDALHRDNQREREPMSVPMPLSELEAMPLPIQQVATMVGVVSPRRVKR